jgi:signal peptidase I
MEEGSKDPKISPAGTETPKNEVGFWAETGRFFVVIFSLALLIRLFVATPFVVSGSSMYPVFQDKNYLIVDKLSYRFNAPERNDVIVFLYPGDATHRTYYVKRIIGLPGEKVQIVNGVVNITKTDGTTLTLSEPYIREPFTSNYTLTLDTTHYFVMGDNRNESSDSRSWGPLEKDLITGHVLLRLYPFNEISVLPGEFKPQ